MKLDFRPRTVLGLQNEGSQGLLLTLAWDEAWRPGQVVAVCRQTGDQPRFYSIVTGPSPQTISLLFTVVEGGELTPFLAGLQPDDNVLVSSPFGNFADADGPTVWIANGTGVAPFYSMLKAGATSGRTLVQGAKTRQDLYFAAEFRAALGDHYIPCCSQDSGEGLYAGRLTAWLKAAVWPAGTRFLLCGSAAMIVDVRDILIQQGVSFDAILSEIYF